MSEHSDGVANIHDFMEIVILFNVLLILLLAVTKR